MCALATRLAHVFLLIMRKGKIYLEFILCDGLVIALNRTHFSPAQISSFRVFGFYFGGWTLLFGN